MLVRSVGVTAMVAALTLLSITPGVAAEQNPPPRLAVCTLLPKEEVKRHLPWEAMFDLMPLEEEPIGQAGSSCSFPTVHVQVLPYTPGFFATFRTAGAQEAVAGVGDEAWFRNNRDRYAELVVKVGPRILTLQADADGGIAAARRPLIELAKAYVARLR
ncbi:MAG: hypothetical protein AB7U83_23010 [Vicinamibacterales bacterium]